MPTPRAHCLLLDVGGQSLRAALLADDGQVLALERRALTEYRPRPGWVEHDAAAMLADLQHVMAAIAGRHASWIDERTQVGLSCQRASVVCWDRECGAPLSPVISWQDSRGAALLDAAALDTAAVQARTGMRPSAFLGVSKLAWCSRELPAVGAAARAGCLGWGPLGSFLLHRLLGERPYRCPASLAQRSLLFDPQTLAWDDGLCAAFAIDRASLPAPTTDLDDFGSLAVAGFELPFALCAGDQNLLPAALGLGVEDAALNLGTGAFLLAGGDGADPRLQRSVLPGRQRPPRQVQEATVNGAAAADAWWSRRAGAGTGPLPASSDDTPHFLNSVGGLASPIWRVDLAPRFSRPPASVDEGRAAIADGLVHLLMLNLEALRAQRLGEGRLYVGGGLAGEDGLLQRLADLAGVEVLRPRQRELSLLGAAVLLGAQPQVAKDCAVFRPGSGARRAARRWRAWRDWFEAEIRRCPDQAQGKPGSDRLA